ncbi:MAG: SRPBCC domain-containing protein [Sphingomonadales bacterium]|nr:SRPBCC domain-containing protein [Sphingomonadales bacterium]MDE2569072.1 SRPBCC domain-containing protein [Sphingomonadales bacterium]
MSHELSVTRHIAAPPQKVWQVMTERMGEWWCPAPWRAVVERLDCAPGGQSLLVMHGPNGEENRHDGFILAWDEGRRFAMTDAIAGDLEPFGPFMIGIWEVTPDGEGARYTARARHWTPEALAHHREMGFEQGWSAVADQLKALCEAG